MGELLVAYYKKYQTNFVPVTLILASLFIVYRVIFPQFASISETRRQIEGKEKEISALELSLQTLQSISDQDISLKLSRAESALPNGKEIIRIFTTLTKVAGDTQAELKSFSLRVGNVYTKSKKTSNELPPELPLSPSLTVQTSVSSSSYSNLIGFANELRTALPLAEIETVRILGNEGKYQIKFYYKPYNLTQFAKQENIVPFSDREVQWLANVEEWGR